MILEDTPTFTTSSLTTWLLVVAILYSAGLLLGLLVAIVQRRSLGGGLTVWARQLTEVSTDFAELLSLSGRHPLNRALRYGLAVFGLLAFLFAVLFLVFVVLLANRHQAKDYITFGLRTSGGLALLTLLGGLVRSFFSLPGRRIRNLARHSVKESIHRGVLYAFVVFAVLFLFAGWYIDPGSRDQVKNYITFVLKVTGFLTLLMGLLLSCFSLPQDIRSKTIHTVVTKPVRRSEIVLGRFLGFSLLGTVILLAMGGVSLAFVYRGLDHRHGRPDAPNEPLDPASLVFYQGETESAQDHQHTVRLDARGNGVTDEVAGHSHRVVAFEVQPAGGHTHALDRSKLPELPFQGRTSETNGHFHLVSVDAHGNGVTDRRLGHYHQITNHRVGRPLDQLVARVPIYGDLRFRGRQREKREKGYNVGYIWEYRSYIEGGTPSAAIWDFKDLHPEQFGDALHLEATFEVYRTMKGNVEEDILAQFTLIRPGAPGEPERRSRPFLLGVEEGHLNTLDVPRNILDAEGNEIDVYRDLITRDGRLTIEVSCASPQQYLGMAQADLWMRAGNHSFLLNFAKSLLCIWLQMVLIICVGVLASTFLSGPMAGLVTLAVILSGMSMPFIREVGMGNMPGAVESIIRLITGKSEMAELDPTPWVRAGLSIDHGIGFALRGLTKTLPDLGSLGTSAFVADGFDIPFLPNRVQGRGLALHLVWTLGYCLPYILWGYVFLKVREIGR